MTPPSREGEQTTLRVVTCNTQGRSDSAADFRHTVARVHDQAPDVVGWQEVNDEPDKAAVKAGMPGYRHLHLDLSVPISVDDTRWDVLDGGRLRTHGGKAKASPARWVTWATIQHRHTGRVLTYANTHYVSGAWNAKPKRHKAWRRRAWTQHHDRMADLLARLAVGPVIFGGDFNRRHVTPFPGAVWLDNRGIDKLGIIGEHTATEPRRVRTPSDHDARVVDVTL